MSEARAHSHPHPDELKQILQGEDGPLKEYIAQHKNDHGFQLSLFHIYRSQSDLALRRKAADIQLSTIGDTATKAKDGALAGNPATKQHSELVTLKSTLQTFVGMPECPSELKPALEKILEIVKDGLSTSGDTAKRIN